MFLNKPVFLILVTFTLLIVSRWANDFAALNWDLDIDHMMYFGQRLLTGNFHWLAEYDDKLPVVQMIFAIPAAFDSVQVWFAMSLAFILLGAASSYFITLDVLKNYASFPRDISRTSGVFAALATAYIFTFTYGGPYHVNPAATSTAIAAIALLMVAWRGSKASVAGTVLFVASAFLASVSIGIRPYFLFPIVGAALWLAFRSAALHPGWGRAVFGAVAWVAAIGFFGVLVNVVPYLLIGNIEALVSGLRLMAQDLNPQGTVEIAKTLLWAFHAQPFGVLLLVTLSVTALFFVARAYVATRGDPMGESGKITRRLLMDACVLSVGLPVLLVVMILQKHFWPHYLQMLAPFVGIGFGVFCAVFWRIMQSQNAAEMSRLGNTFAAALVVIFMLPQIAANVEGTLKPSPDRQNDALINDISAFIAQRPDDARDFIALGNMHVHWRLKEPRHGFPHAANTSHIVNWGWWQNAEMPVWFDHPTSAAAYCEKLEESGPSIVFVGTKMADFQTECLETSSIYAAVLDAQLDGIFAFERRMEMR